MLTVIINYCTNDYRFLTKCIESVYPIASQVLVSTCDHFFNGELENRALLKRSYCEHSNVTFLEFTYSELEYYGINNLVSPGEDNWNHYWHSVARYVGFHYLAPDTQYVLFLDVDEIIKVESMQEWLKHFPLQQYTALRFASRVYYQKSCYCGSSFAPSALLVQRDKVEKEMLLTPYERRGVLREMPGTKLSSVFDLKGEPMVDHYSWVRTKRELHQKVVSWGHRDDSNWKEAIDEDLSRELSPRGRVLGFRYQKIDPPWDPLSVEVPTGPILEIPSNVIYVNPKTILQKQIDDI